GRLNLRSGAGREDLLTLDCAEGYASAHAEVAITTLLGGSAMRTSSLAAAVTSAMLVATALTPVRAADMTFERAQNVAKEPQNWLLHHGNYQGHRFSALKDINADNAKNLKVAFTVGLGGIEGAGTRYK